MEHVSKTVDVLLRNLGIPVDSVCDQEVRPEPKIQARPQPTGDQKLYSQVGRFAGVPISLVDLATRLIKDHKTRGIGRDLKLVVLDLVRYTDWDYGDVVVTNQGIKSRTAIGLSSVKACLAFLCELRVVKKSRPTNERLGYLQERMTGGFSTRRRYLVWNHPDQWQVYSPAAARTAKALWATNRGTRKGPENEKAEGDEGPPP